MIWVVIVSAALSGFFSLCSYSLRAVRQTSLLPQFQAHPGRLDALEKHLTAFRLTASFCRALCNLLMVVALLYLFNPPERGWQLTGVLAATALAAGIVAIVAVAIPHAWAGYAGAKVLAATFVPLLGLRYALFPIVAIMQAFDVPVRRLAGAGEGQSDGSEMVKQEILQAASEGAAEGTVRHDEVRMIASVIEFGRRSASEIMTPRTDLFALPVEMTWSEACRRVVEAGHSRVPVFEGDLDTIVGILYAKDLLRHVGAPEPANLRAIMRKPFFVPETKPINDLLREFKVRRVHFSVVLDEYGGTAGVVTIEDILEEIVGEISDEYDQGQPVLMHRLDDRSTEVDGRMYIDDLNEATGLAIPEDASYTTVAGMVVSELGYIPKTGETLASHGAKFTVLAADERKVTRLKVERLPETAGDAAE